VTSSPCGRSASIQIRQVVALRKSGRFVRNGLPLQQTAGVSQGVTIVTIAKLLIAAGAAMLLLAVVLAFAEPTSQTPVSKDANIADLVRSEREAIKSFEHTATVVAPLASLGILCLVGAGGFALAGWSRKRRRKAEDK